MDTKHTPGPWIVSGARRRGYEAEVIVETNPNPKAMSAITICDVPNPTNLVVDDATAQANARLIAAAPDLLEALKHAYALMQALEGSMWLTKVPGVTEAFAQYSAAIAKAEGRS
jgi:hypothetical protein